MQSMTGYGRGSAESEGREITIELKSVNHRYLDISVRLPRHVSFLEDSIRKELSARLSRGHVDVYVNYRNTRSDAMTVSIDHELLSAYLKAAREASAQFGLTDDITLDSALHLPNVTEFREADEDTEAVTQLCRNAVNAAIDELIKMRRLEGERLKADFLGKIATIASLVDRISTRAPFVVEEYRQKLQERISQLLESKEVDQTRLATEVAIFADRAAIDEEIVRLHSHLKQLGLLMEDAAPVGRKLDFIIQEVNREFNTIGSKANDGTLTECVLSGKNEIEKMREQIQNIE